MSKISLLDLEKYEDSDPIEHIKKKKTGKTKDRKRQKVDKRQGFIDLSDVDWSDDLDS